MSALQRFLAAIDSINDWLGNIVLYIIPVMMLVVTFEVGSRYLFNQPTIWAMEVSQFLFCATISLGGGYALLHDRHVRVDVVHNKLTVRTRALVTALTAPGILIFTGILMWKTLEATMESLLNWEKSASYWAPPLFPILLLMSTGIILIFLQGVCVFIRGCVGAITGNILTPKMVKPE